MREFLIVLDTGALLRARQLWIGREEENDADRLCYVDAAGNEAAVIASAVASVALAYPVPKRPRGPIAPLCGATAETD